MSSKNYQNPLLNAMDEQVLASKEKVFQVMLFALLDDGDDMSPEDFKNDVLLTLQLAQYNMSVVATN